VLRTLKLAGIRAFLRNSRFEATQALRHQSPGIVVIDAHKDLPAEISLIKSVDIYLPKARLVILTPSEREAEVDHHKLGRGRLLPDPLDPELILRTIQEEIKARRWGLVSYFAQLKATWLWLSHKTIRTLPIVATLLIGLIGGYLFWCIRTLPAVETLEDYFPYEASQVYSRDNVLLTEFYRERRTFLPPSQIPKHVKEAILAVEDTRFYKHHGFDLLRILRAFVVNIKAGEYVQGGSTITQQLAKMLLLSPEKTITRKVQELVLSWQIEDRYSKDEILGLYLNQAYFGSRAYGIEAAAQAYFGSSARNLSIAQAALLAALPKAPSNYSPFKDPHKALMRRDFALNRMVAENYISEHTYRQAIKEPLPTQFHGHKFKAPYFIEHCRPVLEKTYDERIYTSGLKIYTTLDHRLQQLAEDAVAKGLDRLAQKDLKGIQAALLAIDLDTGGIRAMVGGTDFWDSQFNRASQAMRQPGSAFKPIVYLTALKMGFSPDDTVIDKKTSYKVSTTGDIWTPRNYGEVYHSRTTLKYALARSLNASTVNIARKLGMNNIIQTAKSIGIQSKIYAYYSSALGASEVTLLELTAAYATLAKGYYIQPICYDRIIDREQLALVEPTGVGERVIDEENVIAMREMLRAVILEGTGRRARVLDRPVYGKTGTTNEYVDALFVGFDERLAVGVWVGRDNHTSIGSRETGASAALPIWIAFMQAYPQPNPNLQSAPGNLAVRRQLGPR
jgi:penicillin-binding protein 1A